MRRLLTPLAISALAALAPAGLAARTLPVRLAPDTEAPAVGRIAVDRPGILNAPPVTDRAKAEAGWKQARVEATWQGYVAESALSKNFEPETGAAVRSAPAADATRLTRVESGDRFEVLQSDGRYATVRFTKPVTVYFRTDNEVAARPAVAAPAPPEPEPERAAQRRVRRNYDPDADVGHTDPDQLPPENVVWSTRSSASSRTAPSRQAEPEPVRNPDPNEPADDRERRLQPIDIMVPPVQTQARERPLRPQADAGTPTRRLSGTLVRKISNFGPAYPLRLESEGGRRIAYVDMTHLFIPNLQPFLDREVVVQGEIRPVSAGGKDIVIHARSIRKLD